MKHQFLIHVLFILLVPFCTVAQEDSTLNLTLKDAQEYAITNNLTLKNARLDIEAAEKKVWETTAIGLPQVSGTVDYQHIPGSIPTFEFVDFQTGQPSEVPLAVRNSTTYAVTANQLVFSGEYLVGLQASKTYLKISELSEEKQELELKANVLNNYFSILILEDNLKTITESVHNMKLLVNETNKMSKIGLLESTDADQLQINLNNLINAQNTIKRQIDVSYKLFKIILGADLNSTLVLTDDLTAAQKIITEGAESEEFQLQNNIDYKIVNNQVKVSELSLKREKTKYLPKISAFYSYQDKTNKASFDFTINHIIGGNISVPIFSSFQRNAQVQQAKIEYQKSLNNKELLENNLQTQVQQLTYSYINALEKYKVADQNVDLSKRVFENTSEKYKQGMVSSMDLTQANNTYLQAESDKINALMELIKTKIELEKILNEL